MCKAKDERSIAYVHGTAFVVSEKALPKGLAAGGHVRRSSFRPSRMEVGTWIFRGTSGEGEGHTAP